MKKNMARWIAGLAAVGIALGAEPLLRQNQIRTPPITRNVPGESRADSVASQTDMREK